MRPPWGYVFLMLSAYVLYSKDTVASTPPVHTLVRPVAPAYLKLTFPRPIPPSPPRPPRPVVAVYSLPDSLDNDSSNPSDLPISPLPPLEHSRNVGPYSVQALYNWFEVIAASVTISLLILPLSSLPSKLYPLLLLARPTQRPISVPKSRSGMIGASSGSPARNPGSAGRRSPSSSPLARGTVDVKSNSRSSSFLVSGGSGGSNGREGKGPEVTPIPVPEPIPGTSGGSPMRSTGSGGGGRPSSPLAGGTVEEKSNSRSPSFSGGAGKGPEVIPVSVLESSSGMIGTRGGSPVESGTGEASSSPRLVDEKSNSTSSSFLGKRTKDDDISLLMPNIDTKILLSGWMMEASGRTNGEGTQQAVYKRKRTDETKSGSVALEGTTRDDRTAGGSEDDGEEAEGDGEDRNGDGEELDSMTQQQTTITRGHATPNTDTTPPDLPSDPNLYKAYICRVLSGIKPAAVIDLTGHIDRDRTWFIAAGGSGEVYKALWKGLNKTRHISTPVALPMVVVKLIRLPPIRDKKGKRKRYKRMKRELELWSKLNHPHILPLIGIARIEGDANLPAFVSPWMENGNVMEFLKQNPSFPASRFLKDIIRGLHYLHTFDPVIVHGDIKGANVLINHRKEAYLSDFGLSHIALDNSLWRTTATHANGTLRWMAPELIEGDVIVPTIATDIYAFGMTCYEILSRGSPFAVANDAVVVSKVIKRERPGRTEACHSDEVWLIITRCWAQQPEDRPSTEETLQLVLQHDTPSNL